MSTPRRLIAFGLVLVVAFGAAWGTGRAVGSSDGAPAPAEVVGDAGQGTSLPVPDSHADHGGGDP